MKTVSINCSFFQQIALSGHPHRAIDKVTRQPGGVGDAGLPMQRWCCGCDRCSRASPASLVDQQRLTFVDWLRHIYRLSLLGKWASGTGAETVGGEKSIPFAAQRCNDATERTEENLVLLRYQLPVTNLGQVPRPSTILPSIVSHAAHVEARKLQTLQFWDRTCVSRQEYLHSTQMESILK